MKRLVKAGGLVCLLAMWAVSATAPANFAGEWALDKGKSELPQMMANGPDITLTVTQDDKQLTVETKRSGGEGGGPGGGGRGGMMMGGGKLAYSLDGKKTTAEVAGPMGNATQVDTEAKWNGEQKLELKSVRHMNFQGNPVDITTKETWELADAGKTLKINRSTESPRGTQEAKLVFTKK
jgi:hypothetical protein